MTAREAAEYFRESYPSPLGEDVLYSWLEELEGKIYREIVTTREGAGEFSFSDDSELAAKEPYSSVYAAYLRMKCDLEFGDTVRYQSSAPVFAAAWSDFSNFYNRTHRPLGRAELKA